MAGTQRNLRTACARLRLSRDTIHPDDRSAVASRSEVAGAPSFKRAGPDTTSPPAQLSRHSSAPLLTLGLRPAPFCHFRGPRFVVFCCDGRLKYRGDLMTEEAIAISAADPADRHLIIANHRDAQLQLFASPASRKGDTILPNYSNRDSRHRDRSAVLAFLTFASLAAARSLLSSSSKCERSGNITALYALSQLPALRTSLYMRPTCPRTRTEAQNHMTALRTKHGA